MRDRLQARVDTALSGIDSYDRRLRWIRSGAVTISIEGLEALLDKAEHS